MEIGPHVVYHVVTASNHGEGFVLTVAVALTILTRKQDPVINSHVQVTFFFNFMIIRLSKHFVDYVFQLFHKLRVPEACIKENLKNTEAL